MTRDLDLAHDLDPRTDIEQSKSKSRITIKSGIKSRITIKSKSKSKSRIKRL